jgi:HEAT repeat protein
MDSRNWMLTVLSAFAASALAFGAGCQGGRAAELTSGAAIAAPRGAASLDPVERSRLREAAIESLLTLSTSEDAQVRANAIEGLIPVGARLESVLPAALADGNPGVRTVAAMAVGKAELRALVPAVTPLLDDASPFVRAAAIYALRSCGEAVDPTPLGAMVTRDPSPRIRAHAAYIIGELGEKGSTALLRDAASQPTPRAGAAELKVLQVQIAEALVKLEDEAQLHTIRAALFPATPEELDATVLAVQVLGAQKDRPSEGQLRNLVGTRDPFGNPMPLEVRLAAAGALGTMGVPDFEAVAVEALATAGDPQRIQASWALGEIGTATAVRHLEGAIAHPAERVRVAVAAALLRAVEPARSR